MKIGTSTVTAIYLGTTSIVSAYLGSTQVFGGASAFTPLSLFSTGAQGIWLDPSDLSTMFSDRAGTTPVTTPGTVVGLRLDKSKGLALGAELVVNGDFSDGSTGWTLGTGWSIAGGAASFSAVTAADLAQTGRSFAANTTYKITFDMTQVSGGGFRFIVDNSGAFISQYFTTTASHTLVFSVGVASVRLRLQSLANASFTIDNISVRELPGNHATAPTDAARPIYGVEPKGGRRNLLTWSEDYSNVVWTKSNATPSIAGVDGNGYSITRLASTAINNFHKVQALGPTGVTVGAEVSGSIILKADGCNWARVGLLDGGGSGYVFINLVTGETGTYVTSGNALTGVTVVSSGTAEWRVTFKRIVQGSAVYFDVGLAKADNDSCFFNGTTADAILIRNTQLELGSTATAYQRVTTAYDITESGVAICHYVQYDGSDDSMSTAAIDFTATDKMSVFAGVRKLSDAALGVIAEAGPLFTGVFSLFAPYSTAATYAFGMASSGSVYQTGRTGTSFSAPISGVIQASGDLAQSTLANQMKMRVNGTEQTLTYVGAGTPSGNFGNHAMFFGRRGNSSLPFNGRDFGIIIVGKTASAGEISDTETWLAARTAQVTI